MKNIICFFVFILSLTINAQTVTGKLVDVNGNGLPGLQLTLYSAAHSYNAVSASDGSFVFNNLTDVKEEELPSVYFISENYPNPFNPKTRILFSVPVASKLNISVFNLLGQKVLEDIQKEVAAGNGYQDFELKGLPNGIYFARLVFDNKYVAVRKLMLLYGSQHLNAGNSDVDFSNEFSALNKKNISKSSEVVIDSILVVGGSIKKNIFNSFSIWQREYLIDLGELAVNTTTSGIPCPGTPTVKYEGKIYNTVQIGNQCWLKENLDVGVMLQDSVKQRDNKVIEKYCINNDLSNCGRYGGLYQWDEVMSYTTSAGARGICPIGWHVPRENEIRELNKSVTSNSNLLKTTGQGSQTGVGNNSTGFSALLTLYGGYFSSYWSSTEYSDVDSYELLLYSHSPGIGIWGINKQNGISVRCIKD